MMTTEETVVEAPQEEEVVEVVEQPQEEVAQQPEEDKHELPKGVQKRIDRAVRQKYEAEAKARALEERLAALEDQVKSKPSENLDKGEPKLENYDTFDEYVTAKAAYIAEKRINETLSAREKRAAEESEKAAHQKSVENWTRRVVEFTAEAPDFDEVLSSSDVPLTRHMQEAIIESDIGPKVAYYLANNPDEALEISRMGPLATARAIGRLEAKLTAPAVKKTSNAPAPVKTVGARVTASKDPDKMSTEEWLKWRQEQLRNK